jgi:nucleotide-binding universal stress UspA family protein
MARESGGVLRIIHVLEDLAQVMAYDYYGAYPGDLAKVLQDNGQKVLADALAIAKSSGVETEDRLLEARGMRLGEAVVQEATQFNADLVVVGTHGRRGLGRVLLGSGAEQVIRLSPIPVLVIRSPEQAPAPAQAGPAGMPSHA